MPVEGKTSRWHFPQPVEPSLTRGLGGVHHPCLRQPARQFIEDETSNAFDANRAKLSGPGDRHRGRLGQMPEIKKFGLAQTGAQGSRQQTAAETLGREPLDRVRRQVIE
ncbi:hypothetical protein ACU4GR_08380 (plasmid) [Methylobacterium oryzae CBMB20]